MTHNEQFIAERAQQNALTVFPAARRKIGRCKSDVKVSNFDLDSPDCVPLLRSTHLQFTRGRRCGLVERNGAGKSSLLRAISSCSLDRFLKNLKVVHVEQEAAGDDWKPWQDFGMVFAVNMASGSLAAAGSLTIVYPLDHARTRLASDVGSGKKTFDGLFVCLKKTAAGPKGIFSLHAGFGVSLEGIIPLGGNPWKNISDMMGFVCVGTDTHHNGRWCQQSLRHCPQTSPDAGREAS